ncbi:MAG: aldo/keto reductase, partial [Rhodospirillaceae bacterium]
MDKCKYGQTDLTGSAVVFGGGWVGGIIIDADDDTRRAAIRMALDGGVNWIDTAPLYGQGKSEMALGWLLKEIDEEPIVSTKVEVDTANLSDYAGQFQRSMEA